MINFGQIILGMTLALSLFQVISKDNIKVLSQKTLSITVFSLFLGSFSYLTYKYIISDFSLLNVFMNSNTMKPLLYKVTGVWGNHEGSMLLFALLLSAYSAAYALVSKSKYSEAVLQIQAGIITLLTGYIYFTSNPFEATPTFKGVLPEQGRGLNPLLQDIGLAIHPPILYLGYAGLSIVFSYVCVAIRKNLDAKLWAEEIKNWVLWCWSFITIGVALGSWWAYRELGWGGFWFWDPVENISLMPWLISCAMMHSLLYTRKFGGLNRTSMFLGLASFLAALAGFFLVRSGIISSVHSFASDPTRGIVMLSIVFAISIYAAVIFGKNFFVLKPNIFEDFGVLSRQALVIYNIMLLLVLTATIKLGVIYPIFLSVFNIADISVGEPYFNKVFVPIAILLCFVMILTPFIKWQNEKLINVVKKSGASFAASLLAVGLVVYYNPDEINLRACFALFMGCWLIFSLVEILTKRAIKREKISKGFFAMSVAHIGFGGLCIAIALVTSLSTEKDFIISEGKKMEVDKYEVFLRKSEIIQKKNYFAQKAEIILSENKNQTKFTPENRIYFPDMSKTYETDIKYSLSKDLYMVMGESTENGDNVYSFPVRFYIKPFIAFIWISSLLIAIGGFIAMLPKKK